jgi:hypothetical protein
VPHSSCHRLRELFTDMHLYMFCRHIGGLPCFCSCNFCPRCCHRWWEKDQRQPTADDFHAHAVREMQQWRDCVEAADLATCVRRYQPQQLVKGMYSQFLQVRCLQ